LLVIGVKRFFHDCAAKTILLSLTFAGDLAIVAAAWLASYLIRFVSGYIPLRVQHIPSFSAYAWMALLVLLIWAVVLRSGRLYQEKTVPSLFKEVTCFYKRTSRPFWCSLY